MQLACAVGSFGAVVDVEFGVDAFEVLFDGADGDDEFLRDLFVRHALCEKVENFDFAGAEGFGEGLVR